MPIYSKTHNHLGIDNGRQLETSPAAVGVRSRLETSPAAVGVRSLNNCPHTFGLYYKTVKKWEILRSQWVWRVYLLHETGQTGRYLHGFVQIQMESKEHGTAGLLPHHKQLSDGDWIARGTRRTFEA